MNVLISAIACDPTGGSEGSVGWNAVQLIAERHDVRVLVHASCEEAWRRARAEGLVPPNVEARFLCSAKPWHPNRMIARLQSWSRYMEFNRHVLAAALAWHGEKAFDLAHHVTYATWRVPSPLWRLPVPFIWGPIGGAANFPNAFFPILSPSARAFEALRKFSAAAGRRSRGFRDCVENSTLVIAANVESEDFLRPYRGGRAMTRLPVTYLTADKIERFRRPAGHTRRPGSLRLFAGGNMIGSKGLALAVRALAKVKSDGVDFHYTIAGGGPEYPKIQALVKELRLCNEVTLHPGFQGDDYPAALRDSDIYFLPSFRETTPITLIEALLAGCHPIVADASAPGELMRELGGDAVAADSPEEMVEGLATAVLAFSRDGAEADIAESLVTALTDKFSRETYRDAIMEAYRSCVQ